MKHTNRTIVRVGLLVMYCASSFSFVSASQTEGTILASSSYAQVCHNSACTSYGTINFKPSGLTSTTSIVITDTAITGYAWGNEFGWVNMAPTNGGVMVNSATGQLSGSAWAQNSGWINFRPTSPTATSSNGIPIGVSINSSGEFYGYAWAGGAFGGWIKFDCSSELSCVRTDYRAINDRRYPQGGSYFVQAPLPPSYTQPPQVQQTTTVVDTSSRTSIAGIPITPFVKSVQIGSIGNDIKLLQAFLKDDSTLYPEGLVTGYFGPATQRALQRFQEKHGIAKKGEAGYGNLGPKTRAKINELMKSVLGTTPTQPSSAPISESKPSGTTAHTGNSSLVPLTKNVTFGSTSPDINVLQTLLSQDKTLYPEGLVTGYFGPATQRALQRFQEKHGIAKKGEAGYGNLGPKTRAKINELMNN